MSIEAPPLERKLVAVLAADVEGYSRMMHHDEEATLLTLSAHRVVIDNLIAGAGGNITSTAGDSVLAEFGSVVAAVNCAAMIQTSLAAANATLDAGRQMQFRIGINVGDVMVKDGGIFGDGVNVAARVEALAPPGGVCVTRGVRDHVRDRVEYAFQDAGDHHVKNIARPIHVFRMLIEDGDTAGAGGIVGLSLADPPAGSTSDAALQDVELAFWKSVELGGSPAEFQAYLDRYPDGAFAPIATARLEARQPVAAVAASPDIEMMFWDTIKDSPDPQMFRAYLDKFPQGEFTSIAELKAVARP